MVKKKKSKKRKPSLKTMRRRLDNIVRLTSKLFFANVCATCSAHRDETPSKMLHWSHYISRRHIITRWDIRNCIAQCATCHQRYTDGFCGPMVKAINKIWGEVHVNDVRLHDKGIFSYSMTDWLENIASKNRSIKGTLWNEVDFRRTLEIKYQGLHRFLEEGGKVSIEQLELMKELGYPNCKELQTHYLTNNDKENHQ